MRSVLGFVAVVGCAAFIAIPLSARAPTPPDGVPPDALKAVKPVLPSGWSATATGVTITVRREQKVGLYNPIGAPDLGVRPPRPTVIEPYESTLRFRPRVTAEGYEKLREQNRVIETKLDALRDGLRAARVAHKFDDWLPSTPEQTKLVAEYRATQKAMPYHRLPDLYTDTHSIDLDDSVRFPLSFTDAEEAKECGGMKNRLRALFKPHGG